MPTPIPILTLIILLEGIHTVIPIQAFMITTIHNPRGNPSETGLQKETWTS